MKQNRCNDIMNSPKKILVIEDDENIRKAIETKLKSVGFNVLTASDGSEGYNTALSERPDLILLDVILPVMDGVTVLDKLRADAWGKDVPIIILSNLSKVDAIEESKQKGVKHYLVKTDWKLEDVVDKIRSELGT